MSFKKLLFFIILMNGWQNILDMLPYNKFPSETLVLYSSWFAGIAVYISHASRDTATGTLSVKEHLAWKQAQVMLGVSRARTLSEMAVRRALGHNEHS